MLAIQVHLEMFTIDVPMQLVAPLLFRLALVFSNESETLLDIVVGEERLLTELAEVYLPLVQLLRDGSGRNLRPCSFLEHVDSDVVASLCHVDHLVQALDQAIHLGAGEGGWTSLLEQGKLLTQ